MTMIQVEQFYGYPLKTMSIFLAGLTSAFELFFLIFDILYKTEVVAFAWYSAVWVDYGYLWKFIDSDESFYSSLAVKIMLILAALGCVYGVVRVKPNFMIPILVLIPVGLGMELIFVVFWFKWWTCIIFIIHILLSAWVCFCFYAYSQQLRKSRVGLYTNITREEKCICDEKALASKNFKLFAMKNSCYFCDKILMGSDQQQVPVHRLVMASLSLPIPSLSSLSVRRSSKFW